MTPAERIAVATAWHAVADIGLGWWVINSTDVGRWRIRARLAPHPPRPPGEAVRLPAAA